MLRQPLLPLFCTLPFSRGSANARRRSGTRQLRLLHAPSARLLRLARAGDVDRGLVDGVGAVSVGTRGSREGGGEGEGEGEGESWRTAAVVKAATELRRARSELEASLATQPDDARSREGLALCLGAIARAPVSCGSWQCFDAARGLWVERGTSGWVRTEHARH